MVDNVVWKLHKAAFSASIRCATLACFQAASTGRIERQLRYLGHLRHIIRCVRAYRGLHPAFAAHTYGDLAGYLNQQLSRSEQDVLFAILHPASARSTATLALDL